MERLKELITQLKEQFDHKAEPAQLLEITRLLEAEIRLMASQPPAPARVTPTKIAVMMPSSTKIVAAHSQQPAVSPVASTVPVAADYPPPVTPPVSAATASFSPGPNGSAMTQSNAAEISPAAVAAPTGSAAAVPTVSAVASPVSAVAPPSVSGGANSPAPGAQSAGSQASGIATAAQTSVVNGTATLKANPERGQWPFDPLAEKPTDRFTLSQKAREVNDVIGAAGASSLNDKLRSDVVDLKSTLNDSPVRDLKKAIGLNDRYLFINQLFRGDEVMYERSLKTINGFRILPEAEYWMERELKVKLGWDENRETTRHFYQLVKRRFS
jgi:hypothetical protein